MSSLLAIAKNIAGDNDLVLDDIQILSYKPFKYEVVFADKNALDTVSGTFQLDWGTSDTYRKIVRVLQHEHGDVLGTFIANRVDILTKQASIDEIKRIVVRRVQDTESPETLQRSCFKTEEPNTQCVCGVYEFTAHDITNNLLIGVLY
jgi:hypothetical protein